MRRFQQRRTFLIFVLLVVLAVLILSSVFFGSVVKVSKNDGSTTSTFTVGRIAVTHETRTPAGFVNKSDTKVMIAGKSTATSTGLSSDVFALLYDVLRCQRPRDGRENSPSTESYEHLYRDIRNYAQKMCGAASLDTTKTTTTAISKQQAMSWRRSGAYGEVISHEFQAASCDSLRHRLFNTSSHPHHHPLLLLLNLSSSASSPPNASEYHPVKTIRNAPLLRVRKQQQQQNTQHRTSRYLRYKRASWIKLDNVCMSCEEKRLIWTLNPRRRCHMTLWSTGDDGPIDPGLTSPARKGHHSIFLEREAAFQYGGVVNASLLRDEAVWATTDGDADGYADADADADGKTKNGGEGAVLYVPSYHETNVGHILHDAHWAVHQVLLSQEAAKFHAPITTMMVDDDFPLPSASASSASGGDFYATLTVGTAVAYDAALAKITQQKRKRLGIVTNPVPKLTTTEKKRFLCFRELAIPGADRSGLHGGYREASRWRVAGSIRESLFGYVAFLHTAGPDDASPSFQQQQQQQMADDFKTGWKRRKRNPQIVVYARTDMHRRSIDNSADLLNAVATVATEELGIPPPSVVSSFSALTSAAQIAQMTQTDIFVAVQGAHLQHSLFMPQDGVVIEISPCMAKKTSFLYTYGVFLPRQVHRVLQVCSPSPINTCDGKYAQNVTLCPHHLKWIADAVREEAVKMMQNRKK